MDAIDVLVDAFGRARSDATRAVDGLSAADLVWRAATYVPQVVLGALTFLWWRVTTARRRQRATERNPSG